MWKLLPVALVLALVAGCSDDCSNTVVASKDAPDAQHSAVLFQRDCGATTGYSTQLSIVETGEQPSGTGNIFIADDDHGSAQAAEWGGPWAEMVWLSPDRLLVRYDAKSRIFKQVENASGVTISFQTVTR